MRKHLRLAALLPTLMLGGLLVSATLLPAQASQTSPTLYMTVTPSH